MKCSSCAELLVCSCFDILLSIFELSWRVAVFHGVVLCCVVLFSVVWCGVCWLCSVCDLAETDKQSQHTMPHLHQNTDTNTIRSLSLLVHVRDMCIDVCVDL